MSFVIPSFKGFMKPPIASISSLQNIITSLGYTPDVITSVRKTSSEQTYAGLINVTDTGIDYKVAWDLNGFISANSSLYNTSDILQGTVQSIIVDNSYSAGWKTFCNQILGGSAYDFSQTTLANRPLFATTGTLKTYDGTNVGLFFSGSTDYYMTSTHINNSQPRTVIGVAYNWSGTSAQDGTTFISGFTNGSLHIRKSKNLSVIDLIERALDVVATSSSTIPATGRFIFGVGVYENNVGASNHDVRFWINGSLDSEKSDNNAMAFTGTDSVLGINKVGTSQERMNGYILEYISIPALLTNDDIAEIYNNQNGAF